MKSSPRSSVRRFALIVAVACTSAVLVTGCGGAKAPTPSPSSHLGGPIGAPDAGTSIADDLFGTYTPPATSGVSDLSTGGASLIAAGYGAVPGASTLDDVVLDTTSLSDDANPLASGLTQLTWDSAADAAQQDAATLTDLSLDDPDFADADFDDPMLDDPGTDADPAYADDFCC